MSEEELSKDLTLLAIFGIRDPLRAEIPSAIAKCKSAGILVRMVTGDNSETAVSIAKKSGILDKEFDLVRSQAQNEYWVMEGAKFSKLIGGVVDVPSEEDPKVTELNIKISINCIHYMYYSFILLQKIIYSNSYLC